MMIKKDNVSLVANKIICIYVSCIINIKIWRYLNMDVVEWVIWVDGKYAKDDEANAKNAKGYGKSSRRIR